MFLILILAMIILILLGIILVFASVGGAAFILVFGDVIVCIIFLVWLIKKIIDKRWFKGSRFIF